MSTIVANKVAKEIPGENLPNPKYGSRDFADGINQFRMVDNFLKSYFANDNWLVARNRNFAGFNGNQRCGCPTCNSKIKTMATLTEE